MQEYKGEKVKAEVSENCIYMSSVAENVKRQMSSCIEQKLSPGEIRTSTTQHIRREVGDKLIQQRELTKPEKGVLAKQLWLEVSAALADVKAPLSTLTTENRKALSSLSRDRNITISPADKGRCTAAQN